MKRPILAAALALAAGAATAHPAHAWSKTQFSCGLSFCREHSGGFYYSVNRGFGCAPPPPCCGGPACCGPACGPAMFNALPAYGPAAPFAYGAPAAPSAVYGDGGHGAPIVYGAPAAPALVPAPAAAPAPNFVAPRPTPGAPAPAVPPLPPAVKPTAQQVGYTAPAPYGYSGYGTGYGTGYGYGYGYGAANGAAYNQAPSYWYGD
jgi:hypothetical protein